jgi:hypothetical protein
VRYILILFCFFLFSCGGDGNGHHTPPLPPAPIPEPIPEPTPLPEPTPTPEPTDCCPKGENVLMCKNYLTESPYLTVQCNQKGYWYLTVKDAYTTVPLWIKLPLPDLSCCSIEKTGLVPEQCKNGCQILYAQPTDWILMSDIYGWYIRNNRTMEGYRVIK